MICYECNRSGFLKWDCPQLIRKNDECDNKKKKENNKLHHTFLINMKSENSKEETNNETRNLCLMDRIELSTPTEDQILGLSFHDLKILEKITCAFKL